MAGPMIEVRNLLKTYGKALAVDHVSFSIEKGESLSLLGPSGCGKTTTLRSIAGLEEPNDGEIYVDGKLVTSPSQKIFVPPEKRNLGLVFQSYALWPNKTVFETVAYGLKTRKFSKDQTNARVQSVLELLQLKGFEKRYPSQLSGGQQQRVALARCLAYEPKVLLLDEPLSNLDLKERERVRIELRKLIKRLGITALYVTHDQDEAFVMSDRIMVMSKGHILQSGTPQEIYEQPGNQFVANFIGRTNMFKGNVRKTSDEHGILTIDGFGVELRCNGGFQVEGPCLAVVRPNEIILSKDKPPKGVNLLRGEVIEREFRGSVSEHRFVAGQCELVVITHRFCAESHSTFGPAYVQIPEESIVVLPPREDEGPAPS